jgi:branched-chain amino acid transport system substrate-binding protein
MGTSLTASRAACLTVALALAVSACGGSSSTDQGASGASPGAAAASLGTPNPAAGEPIVFGMLNLETGPVTFPELRQGAEAAIKYVNEYRGGIGGRPIKLVTCATDGQPATSARCANQILDAKPVAILGGADTGAPGAFPVWERANLAYLGGVPFTPFENSSPNSVQFVSVAGGDNAAAAVYAGKTLGAKTVSVLYTDDSQGARGAKGIVEPTLKAAGVTNVKLVPVPPSSADVSAQAAAAVGDNPDLVYIYSPNACANLLRALATVGSTSKLMGLGLCAAPQVLEAAGPAAVGYYSPSPLEPIFGPSPDAQLLQAVIKKYAPADLKLSDTAVIGFQTVMNVQTALAKNTPADLSTDSILTTFRTGTERPNFLAHPYTCDGKQLTKAPAICNSYQLIYQVKDGKNLPVSTDWVTAEGFFAG